MRNSISYRPIGNSQRAYAGVIKVFLVKYHHAVWTANQPAQKSLDLGSVIITLCTTQTLAQGIGYPQRHSASHAVQQPSVDTAQLHLRKGTVVASSAGREVQQLARILVSMAPSERRFPNRASA